MNNNTFGDPDLYPALVSAIDMINKLSKKRRRDICSLIHNFNHDYLELKNIKNINPSKNFYEFIILSTRNDYSGRLIQVSKKYDMDLLNHIKNYIYAKLRNLKR